MKKIFHQCNLLFQLSLNFLLQSPKMNLNSLKMIELIFGKDSKENFKKKQDTKSILLNSFLSYIEKHLYRAIKLIPKNKEIKIDWNSIKIREKYELKFQKNKLIKRKNFELKNKIYSSIIKNKNNKIKKNLYQKLGKNLT